MSVDQLVTYSNTSVDLAPMHAEFDRRLPDFEKECLGRTIGAIVREDRNVADGTPYESASPIDHRIHLGTIVSSSDSVIDRAVRVASDSAPAWSALSWNERVAVARRFSKCFATRRFELAAASLYEVAKSRLEAIGEANEAVELPAYYASEAERNDGYFKKLRGGAGESAETALLPFGVFAIVAPFNFPVALAVNMIAAALIAGNTVVFKPAKGCEVSGRLIVEAALDAGAPPGVINMVVGGAQVGRFLVAHPLVSAIAFTGSYATGMNLARLGVAGKYAKPVIAEMGGKNPAYITASADLNVATEGVARSAFGLQGQKCSACSVVYVAEEVAASFIEKLCTYASTLALGDPRERATFLGAVFSKETLDRFERACGEARSGGAVLYGGRRRTSAALMRGYYLEPTIVSLESPGPLTRDELFMPFLAVRRVKSLATALEEGNDVIYGLTAGIYTREKRELDLFLKTAQAGVLYANRASGATTGAWPGMQSFCGWKGSGLSNKGGLGPNYLPLFTREQSRTLVTW